jgi:hypothetical protein
MTVERWNGDDVDAIVTATTTEGRESDLCVLGTTGIAPAGAAAVVIGVIVQGAAVGMNTTYQFKGIAKVRLGGTVTMGASIASSAAARGVAATTGQFAIGKAREAGVANQYISVTLLPHAAP